MVVECWWCLWWGGAGIIFLSLCPVFFERLSSSVVGKTVLKRGGEARLTRRAHNPEIGCSNHLPATSCLVCFVFWVFSCFLVLCLSFLCGFVFWFVYVFLFGFVFGFLFLALSREGGGGGDAINWRSFLFVNEPSWCRRGVDGFGSLLRMCSWISRGLVGLGRWCWA